MDDDSLTYFISGMSIEEVSVLFDTGRKGDINAATSQFHGGKSDKELAIMGDEDGLEKDAETATVSRVERSTG